MPFNIKTPSKINEEKLQQMSKQMARDMKKIYGNHSSDEYKMRGDITKSNCYSTFESLINDLPTLKHFPAGEAKDIKTMFLTLHRPVWKKMVSSYIATPDKRNTAYTIAFTLGYRVLRGELARIYSSTEATEKGIVYKPDKIARNERILKFIRYYNDHLESLIEEAIKHVDSEKGISAIKQESAVSVIAGNVVDAVSIIFTLMGNVFRTAKEVNPISFISALLSRSYDKKIERYDEVAAMYEASKKAYEEYKKIPDRDRNKKIESNYVKNIEKYNIKMNNLKAKIDHYDQRATETGNDFAAGRDTEDTVPDEPTTTSNEEENKNDDTSSSSDDKDDNTSSSDDDNGGFDF